MYYFARTHNFGLTPQALHNSAASPFSQQGPTTNPGGIIQLLDTPQDVVYDSLGNAYVANTGKHHIMKVDPLQNLTTFAGSPEGFQGYADGTGINAMFNSPVGLAIDSADNIYVTDLGNYRIRKITPAGVVTTIAGGQIGIVDGTGINAGFHTLSGIAYDSASTDLFVLDFRKVRRVTQAGVVTTFTGASYSTLTNTGKELYSFTAIPYHMFNTLENKTLIFTRQPVEGAQGTVGAEYEISPSGVLTPAPSLAPLRQIISSYTGASTVKTYYEIVPRYTIYAFSTYNWLYQFDDNDTQPFLMAGNALNLVIDGQGNQASFKNPKGLAIAEGPTPSSNDDILYLTDDHTIRKVVMFPYIEVDTISGSPTSSGDVVGVGSSALFNNPTELCVNPSTGDIYVCDTNNNKIKKVTSGGFVANFIGTGIAGNIDGFRLSADITEPRYIVFHPNGKLYFWSRFCLKECDINTGIVTTVAGDYYQSGETDGSGTNARFFDPHKIVVNQDGDFLVYDRLGSPYLGGGKYRIRKITLSGFNVSTFTGFFPLDVADGTNTTTKVGYSNGIAIDSTGQIFITDVGPLGGYVRKIDGAGNTTLFAGSEPSNIADGTGVTAGFAVPTRMKIDNTDNLYLVDYERRVRRVDPAANVTTVTGVPITEGVVNGPVGTALFEKLYGIGLNPVNNDILLTQTGYAYVSNPLLRLVSAGMVTTIPTTGIGPVIVTPPPQTLTPNNDLIVIAGPDGLDAENPSVILCCYRAPANEPISQYDVVYLYQGTIRKLDQPTTTVRPYMLGIARNSANIGEDVYLQYQGSLLSDDVSPFPFPDPSGTLYYAGASGALTTTPPVSGYRAAIARLEPGGNLNLCPVFLGDSHIEFDLTSDVVALQQGIWSFVVPPLTITVSKPWIQIIGGYAFGSFFWMDWTQYFHITWDGNTLTLQWKGDVALHVGSNQRLNFGKVYMANYTVS